MYETDRFANVWNCMNLKQERDREREREDELKFKNSLLFHSFVYLIEDG
jgi:hypothetical protein